MNKIDTEYASLEEVPQSVVKYYEEEVRTRTTGHTEPDEEGNTDPITEEYTVVVLNKPDTVLYSDVAQRIGERKSRDVVNAELVRAIEWEEFYYGHDLVLEHEADYALWEQEQPTEIIGEEEVVIAPPEKLIIDLRNRREHYEKRVQSYDTNLFIHTDSAIEYDDTNYVVTTIPVLENKPAEEVSAYHAELAIETRYNAVYAPLAFDGSFIDTGRGKDGVLGIDNIKDALSAYEAGMTGVESVMWIMTDNSVKELTIDDLRQVIIAFNTRKQVVFMQYGTWRETDRLTPFEVTYDA